MDHLVIASAFGDAATKIIAMLVEIRSALLAMIVLGAALGVVFDRGHKGAILGSAILAVVLIMGMTTIGTSF